MQYRNAVSKWRPALLALMGALSSVSYAENACDPGLQTIFEVVVAIPDLSILVAASQDGNLPYLLSLPGPVNVFAPTNAAFDALVAQYGVYVDDLLEETLLVNRILQLHVVTDGTVCSGGLSGSIPTNLAGEYVTVYGNKVCSADNCANIIAPVPAGNGVVYLIDAILLPTPDADYDDYDN